MMQTLLLQTGELVHITSTSLPLGKFVKIQPQSVDFLDISDPKAVIFLKILIYRCSNKHFAISQH